jgi:urea carboxylase
MFKRVLIANRGVIACRVIRTLRRLGVESVAVYSDADRPSLHVAAADHAVRIGEPQAARSYLDVERILAAARETGAEAIHPGYGFLAENDAFAERCGRDGVVFVGPTPEQMRAFGLKHTARRLAAENDVPLLPGSALLDTAEDALAATGGSLFSKWGISISDFRRSGIGIRNWVSKCRFHSARHSTSGYGTIIATRDTS